MRERAVHFATCAPGLEGVLHAEVKALRLGRVEQQVGGVRFEGSMRDAWRANLWLRTAIRVLRRVARFEAPDAEALLAGAREVAWEEFLRPDGTLLVDARSTRSALGHTRFVEQVVKDAVVDRFRDRTGRRPSVDRSDPDLRIDAHLVGDRATLSVDTSGHSLHKRGWRRHQGPAPLPETTAAALVLLSGWDRRAPLLDPFCGSGTILIEAAWIAAGVPPGGRRGFGFERWPEHRAEDWARVREEALAAATGPTRARLVGWERDAATLEQARENAAAAGVAEALELEACDALARTPTPGWNAWIVTNPPFGVRVGAGDDDELFDLWRGLGAWLRERCAGYRVAILSGDPRLRRKLDLDGATRHALLHGGLECELVQVQEIAASAQPRAADEGPGGGGPAT